MPIREGFYPGGAAQAGAHGGFEAAEGYFGQLLNERLKDRQSARELKRQEDYKQFNDVLNDVKAGNKTPEEASKVTGIHPSKFQPFVPGTDETLGRLNTLLKPGMAPEEADVITHALGPFRTLQSVATPPDNDLGFPADIPRTGFDTEDFGGTPSVTTTIRNLIAGKNKAAFDQEKPSVIGHTASEVPPFGQAATDTEDGVVPEKPMFAGDVTPQDIYGKFDPRDQQMHEVGRVAAGPSARTAGVAEGVKKLAAAPGEVGASNLTEAGTRGEKVKTATALQQAHIDTETTPSNVGKEAYKSSAIEYANKRAQDNATLAGIPEEVSQSYVRGTTTGRSYLSFPTGTDHNVISAITRRMASNPATRGTPIVGTQDAEAMKNIEAARANYDNIFNLLKNKLSATYKGNWLQAPSNAIAVLMKTDPDLVAARNDFAQVIQGLRAQAGPFGRITQQEINIAQNAFPSGTNPLNVELAKRDLFYKSMLNMENGILGSKR